MTRQRVPYEVLPFGPSWAVVYCPTDKPIEQWGVVSVHHYDEAHERAVRLNAADMFVGVPRGKLELRLKLIEQSEHPEEWATTAAALRQALLPRQPDVQINERGIPTYEAVVDGNSLGWYPTHETAKAAAEAYLQEPQP